DYLNNVVNNAKSNASKTGIQGKLDGLSDSSTDKELMDACKEFEAYFYEQVFKEMKKSVSFTDSEDAASKQMMDYYEDSLTSEYAKLAAGQQENGFAQMLYEQMKRTM
ncbi:MAG: rod-binding protein, partial [Lachnospiraceae bacterium]|nr:rod-binding protein [Lachnospiraceae bacterium]